MRRTIAGFSVAALATALVLMGGRGTAGAWGDSDEAVRFADQLKKHPAQPSLAKESHGLFLLDVERGEATLIVGEAAPGLTHCGSARWSPDGKRILFDATPGALWNQTHVLALEAGEARPRLTDLGPGNCPSPSPDGKLVAFLLNGGAISGIEAGLWVMNADGSGRRRLGSFGRPFWSPDNRRLLIVSFSDPCRLTLLDVASQEARPVEVPDRKVLSVPSWVDEKTIVAALADGDGRAIALVDVGDPVRIKEVLREKDARPSVTPAYPVFSPAARRCFFVNANPKGMSLYSIGPGKSDRAKRLEPDGFDKFLADLATSPDGKHVIFCSDRAVRKAP